MEAVGTAKAITLAVIIAISGWFHDGLKALQNKEYDKAVKLLTKVYEKKVPGNNFRELALFYRAQAYMGKKDKKKAFADIIELLKISKDKQLIAQATKFYKECGGDMSKLISADSPKVVMQKFIAAAEKGDYKTAVSFTTGMWRNQLKEFENKPDRMKRQFEKEKVNIGKEVIGKGDEAGTATVDIIPLKRPERTVTILFVQDEKTKKWLLSGIKGMEGARVRARGKAFLVRNISNLKQIGLALKQYAMENDDNFPVNLKLLKKGGYLTDDSIYLWTHPQTEKGHSFIYHAGLTESNASDMMIVAAPMAYKGKRQVLFIDGHVESVDEKKFQKNARKEKWAIKGLAKKEDVPKDKQKEIHKLVKQLGDKDFKVRKAASKKLRKMGTDAHPVLEEYLKSDDPEIRFAVKEILEGR